MRRRICYLSCCLLALALWADPSAATARAADPSDEAKQSEQAENAKQAEDVKQAEETKKAEQPKQAEEPKKGEEESKAPAESKGPTEAGPKTVSAKKGLLKIEVTLDGTFEAQKTAEIILRPKAWSTLTVLKAVEHGSEVKEGNLLVSLDTEKIDQAIADARTGVEAGSLALKLAERQLRTLEATTPMDLSASQREQKQAHEDTDHYFKVSRALSVKSADFSLKSAEEYVESAEEELRQLEKMYKADDLTEETEEIILKRQRAAVERAKFYLEREKVDHERTLKVQVPRRDVGMKESFRRTELQAKSSKVSLPLALKKQRMDVEKLKVTQARARENLEKLIADRAAMTIKAPMGGVVYYGKSVRGKFKATKTTLDPFTSLSANQVVMTIVKPRPMAICVTVAEKQFRDIRAGVKGTAMPTAFPDMKLAAIVDRVAAIPEGSGSFQGRITVALDDEAEALMPGMTCKVKLLCYRNKEAITVPPKAIGTDELDDQKHHVFRLDEKGKPVKQCVKVGRRTATKVEIVEGLCAGDKVLAECPKDNGPQEKEATEGQEKKEADEKK